MEDLEPRLAPAGLLNGDFSIGDPADPNYGWTTRGGATIANGQGILDEGTTVQSDLSQSFMVPQGTTALRFTIVASNLVDNGPDNPPDAFEAALLDSTTQAPLVGPPSGLSGTDSFLNIQQTGQVYYASGVTVPGAGASGDVASLSFPEIVTVDLSSVSANTQATLFFDLIGFNPATSVVRVDDVSTFSGPVPPPVSFTLDPATDSGALGDGLTNLNPVNLIGATDPDQVVMLAIGSDGFTDGTTTSDANGHFSFSGVNLAEGMNTLRVQATNAAGTTVSTQAITVDSQIPTGALVSPAPGSTIAIDPGYVDVQWTAPGSAAIDTTAFDTNDVTISGVSVTSVEDLGGYLERYHYSNTNGAGLSTNTVDVTLVEGQVADLAGNTNAQTVQSFTYQPIQAQPDSYSVTQGATLTVSAANGVLANDSTTDERTLTASVFAQPLHGKLTFSADGSFVYTPTPGYVGADDFRYQAIDGSLISPATTVAIQVNPASHAPVAMDDSYATPFGTTLNVAAPGVLANDTDSANLPLTSTLVDKPSHGTATLNADGSFTYIPTAGYSGADSFTYHANNGQEDSNAATVTITVQAAVIVPPVAVNHAYSTPYGTTLTVPAPGILQGDTAASGKPLTAAVSSQPAHGKLTLALDGSFTYVPAAGYSGVDTFTYLANDGIADSNAATVTITVQAAAVTPPPVAVNQSYSTAEGTPLTVAAPGVLANATDSNNAPLTAVLVTQPSHGTLALQGDGSFTYTPAAGFSGVDTFAYAANDGVSDSNAATVTITVNPGVVLRPPVAVDDGYSTIQGKALAVAAPGVLANDVDPNGLALTATIVSQPSQGTLAFHGDGSFTYTPAPGFAGTDSFVYVASDGQLSSNNATVTLVVAGISMPTLPVAVDHSYAALEGHSLTVAAPGVLAGNSSPSGLPLAATLATPAARGQISLNRDGSFTYVPAAGFAGADSFTYTTSDGLATSQAATVTLMVASNHPISILPDNAHFNFLRRRRDRDPANFDRYHPQIGALLALEQSGIPTSPTKLLPDSVKYNTYRAERQANPTAFDDAHPVVGAIFQLESIQGNPTSANLLPDTPQVIALLALRAKDPAKFDAQQTYYAAILSLEAYLAEIIV